MCVAYITEPGTKISKRGNVVCVQKEDQLLYSIPVGTLDELVVADSVQLTSQVIQLLLERDISTIWISQHGRSFGRLESGHAVNVYKQEQQILQQHTRFSLAMSRTCIAAKIHNQVTLLRRYNRMAQSQAVAAAVEQIGCVAEGVLKAADKSQLRGYEGRTARLYFEALSHIIKEPFSFFGRSKYPPTDPVNAMLSLGYTLVLQELCTAISANGLSPYFGFFHALRNRHPALASDLLEEWRAVIVDSFVLSMVQHHEILPDHFCFHPGKSGVYLTQEGRKIFFHAYEKKMETMHQYGQQDVSFRETLRLQVHQYVRALMQEDAQVYQPVWIR